MLCIIIGEKKKDEMYNLIIRKIESKKKKDIENASKFNYGFQRFYNDLTAALSNE